MKELKIKTPKTARVYLSGEITGKTEEIVFAIHGYAQLGKYFIKKFDSIASEKCVVVVPEALNKFYWNGMNGKVVASWMTKEDRLSEIEDYIEYLNTVFELVTKQASENVKITALGFSQGTATICRWILDKNYTKISRLILWAGAMPKDVFFEAKKFKHFDLIFVLGKQDEYISEIDLKNHISEIQKEGINPKTILFDGNHNICLEKTPPLFA